MKYFGINDQYLLQPRSVATLPSWESIYERALVYAEDTDTMYYGTGTGWVAIANQVAGYVHTQDSASATWTVTHSLGTKNVVITVFDSSYNVIMPDTIVADTTSSLTITFSEAVTGVATVVVAFGVSGATTLSTRKVYLPDPTTLADHEWNGAVINGVAGETISRGDLCYRKLNSSAWKMYKYDANGTDKLILPLYIATEDVASASSGAFLKSGGIMRDDTWSLSGTADTSTTVYASATTAGGLTMTPPATSGDEVVVVGFLVGANTVQLEAGYSWVEVK